MVKGITISSKTTKINSEDTIQNNKVNLGTEVDTTMTRAYPVS